MTENTDNKFEFTYADLLKMRNGIKSVKEFLYPGLPQLKIGLRVLTQEEVSDAVSAGRELAHNNIFQATAADIEDFQQLHMLQKACVQMNDSESPFFADIQQLRAEAIGTIATLISYYGQTQEEFSPTEKLESEEDFLGMVEAIKKNKAAGMSLNIHTLRKLVSFMADQFLESPKDNGSTSLPSKVREQTTKKSPSKKSEPAVEVETKKEE